MLLQMRPGWLAKDYLRVCAVIVLGVLVVAGVVWSLVLVAGALARLV